ncbi:hypothetical protein R6Q57_012542 [Mikania cordata]
MFGISRVVSSSPTEDEMYLTLPKACRNSNIGSFDLPEKLHGSDIVTSGFKNVLKTVDKPFCLGQHNEGLCNYTSESERSCFFMDEDCKEENLIISPVVRVFRRNTRRISEWTSDVKNYQSKRQLLHDCAIRLNLHGYLILPAFDSITMLCVDVSELITSSKDLDYAYEFQEVHQALKEANLTSPQAFECPASYVNYKKHKLDEIIKLLKDVCNTHKLPLAQTWTCNSFNTRCIGKVCMSTTGLPFHVKDLRFRHFREASRNHHLLKSKGVVGRALSSHGSCFCFDVTKWREDEYPLVHIARMSGLTSGYVVYLHSNEHDEGHILGFFLPINMKEHADLQNLVQIMKMHFKFSSLEFGDLLSMDMMEASKMPSAVQLYPQRLWETNAQIDYINSQDQCDFGQVSHMKWITAITNSNGMPLDDATSKKIDVVTCTPERRKRKMDSIPIEEASSKLGVNGSTPNRVCSEASIASWPTPHHSKKYVHFGISDVVLLLVRIKRWICLSNHHGFSAKWWVCRKHNPKFACKSNPCVHKRETICGSYAHSGVYQSSPKKNKVYNVLDKRMVTVKATYKDDMIKFIFPLSSGLSKLKKQVAKRFKLEATRLYLNYKDEDDDLILISCDADLRNLMPFSASPVGKNTIKLIVQMVKD